MGALRFTKVQGTCIIHTKRLTMTLQNIEELMKDPITSKLPELPWRVTFPFIATLDVDSFYTPEHPDHPFPGTSAAYGKGFSNIFNAPGGLRMPLTEDFMRPYYPGEGLERLLKLLRDKGWAQPFGNPLFNLWGGTNQNFSNWKVTLGDDNRMYMNTIPLTLAFYEKLRPYFAPQIIEMMQELQLEEIVFDSRGNSLWIKNGVITGTPVEDNPARFTTTGHKEIVDGTGKFKSATGSFHFTGYGDNHAPEREGEPTNTGRMGLWGTVDYWWPYLVQLSTGEWSEEEFRELVQPVDPYQENIIQQVINEKLVAGEAMAQ